ncbi:hypothetical protein ACFY3M_54460 [Streptomyces mirabilis]|uniref:hypothetical protein n=1 Tax=Streptomyces mirabilis TaxID=68239 RepID=UPI0036A7F9FB
MERVITAGVDRSARSRAAAEWAAREALRRRLRACEWYMWHRWRTWTRWSSGPTARTVNGRWRIMWSPHSPPASRR